MNPAKLATGVLSIITLLLLGGCVSRPRGFDSADPAARLEAISLAANQRDMSAIPDLVRLLRSDDPLVRFAASAALSGLTGEDMEYRHEAPEWQREQAVRRWEAWIEADRVSPTPVSASSPRTPYDHQRNRLTVIDSTMWDPDHPATSEQGE